jgi:hypothetical protein
MFCFQMKMKKTLLDLPVEILEQILLYLDHSQIFALRNRTIALLLFFVGLHYLSFFNINCFFDISTIENDNLVANSGLNP